MRNQHIIQTSERKLREILAGSVPYQVKRFAESVLLIQRQITGAKMPPWMVDMMEKKAKLRHQAASGRV